MAAGTLCRSLVGIWILVFGLIYSVEAVLKTTFIEDICSNKKSVVIDLRHEPTGIIMSAPQTESEKPFDCEILLVPPKLNSVVLSIYRYDVADDELLTIEDSDRHKIALLGWGSFKDERKSFISEGKMAIRYKRGESSLVHPRRGFQFTFTKVNDGPCYDNEFHCNNKKCILKEYMCDGHNHCGDGSNLKKCVPKEDRITAANEEITAKQVVKTPILGIILIAAAGIVVFIIVIVFIVVVVRQSKRRKQAASAPISQSPGSGGNLPLRSVSSTAPISQSPGNGGNLSLQSVPSTVPQHLPEASQAPSAPPAPEEPQGVSFYGRVRQSLRGRTIPKVEEAPKHLERAELYQVPSMYPSLDHVAPVDGAVTALDGIVNPEFKNDE